MSDPGRTSAGKRRRSERDLRVRTIERGRNVADRKPPEAAQSWARVVVARGGNRVEKCDRDRDRE
jgi:hypothetical protein